MTNIRIKSGFEYDPACGYRAVVEYLDKIATSEWVKTELEAENKRKSVMNEIKTKLVAEGLQVKGGNI